MQDRKNPQAENWKNFLGYNELSRDMAKLVRVTEISNGPRKPVEEVWVTFLATEATVVSIRMDGYIVNHPSRVDKDPMCQVESNLHKTTAKPLKSLATATLDALYRHRG